MRHGLGVVVLLFIAIATSVLAWRVDLSGGRRHSFDGASAALGLPGGDTVLVTELDCSPAVMRIDATTGAVAWRTARLAQPPSCAPSPPALNSQVVTDGDAVVVAFSGGLVLALDAASGAERWRRWIEGGRDGTFLQALTIDRAGGVVAAGVTLEDLGEPETNFLVVSLDGATGVERWRQLYDGTPGRPDPEDPYWNDTADAAVAAGFDETGDVLVAGTIEDRGRARWFVFRFAAQTGALQWRRRVRRQDIRLLTVDPVSDDVVVAGRRQHRFGGIAVERLDAASGRRRWRRFVRGNAAFGGGPDVLLVAPDGDVGVAGSLVDRDTGRDAAVVWLGAADGSVRWVRVFDGPGSGDDEAIAFALDPTGNPVLAARVSAGDLETSSLVVGLAADGSERWRWTPPAGSIDRTIRALAPVGPDMLAAGQIGDPTVDPDVLAVRLGAVDGVVRWEARIAGTTVAGRDGAAAVAVAPGGDLIGAGYTENDGTGTDFAVIRLAGGTGAVRWRYEVDGESPFFSAFDTAAEVAVDLHGDVIAAGSLQQGLLNRDLFVVKLDGSTGTERWRALVGGTSDDQYDAAGAIETDAAADVVVVGALSNHEDGVSGPELFILKLDGDDGAERWRRTVPLPWGGGYDVAVDRTGDVIVAGAAASSVNRDEFVVLKLAGDTGTERWRVNVVGTGDYFREQFALALALAPDGDVIAAGSIDNFHQDGSGTAGDWLVVRLAGGTGVERWRYVLDGAIHGHDGASGVVLDGKGHGGQITLTAAANGDALVTAPVSEDLVDFNVWLARFAASDGAERWHRRFSGSAVGRDYGAAIVERSDGALVVAGSTTNTDTAEDFTVVTLDGSDGSDLAPQL
jgi:outer membrane protein assembly factor BamB